MEYGTLVHNILEDDNSSPISNLNKIDTIRDISCTNRYNMLFIFTRAIIWHTFQQFYFPLRTLYAQEHYLYKLLVLYSFRSKSERTFALKHGYSKSYFLLKNYLILGRYLTNISIASPSCHHRQFVFSLPRSVESRLPRSVESLLLDSP